MNLRPAAGSNIVHFPTPKKPSLGEFVSSRCKILMKTKSDHPLADVYGIEIVDAVRLSDFNGELNFRVELRHDMLGQSLLCGVVNPDYSRGIAVAMDPSSGAIVDVLNNAGILGYVTTTPIFPHQPIHFEMRIQKFGKNHICKVLVEDESIMYPAFICGAQENFNAIVGSDLETGAVVSYRSAVLHARRPAKVA